MPACCQSLVAAGYVLYSASTELVLTFGHGVVGFTLDTSSLDSCGQFAMLTSEGWAVVVGYEVDSRHR